MQRQSPGNATLEGRHSQPPNPPSVLVLVSSLNWAPWLSHVRSSAKWTFSPGCHMNVEPSELPKLSSTFQLGLVFFF